MFDINWPIVILIIFLVLVLLVVASCIKIVPQAKAFVIEQLGAYKVTWGTGLHFKIPFIDRIAANNWRLPRGIVPAEYHPEGVIK